MCHRQRVRTKRITQTEAARVLGISRRTVIRMCARDYGDRRKLRKGWRKAARAFPRVTQDKRGRVLLSEVRRAWESETARGTKDKFRPRWVRYGIPSSIVGSKRRELVSALCVLEQIQLDPSARPGVTAWAQSHAAAQVRTDPKGMGKHTREKYHRSLQELIERVHEQQIRAENSARTVAKILGIDAAQIEFRLPGGVVRSFRETKGAGALNVRVTAMRPALQVRKIKPSA